MIKRLLLCVIFCIPLAGLAQPKKVPVTESVKTIDGILTKMLSLLSVKKGETVDIKKLETLIEKKGNAEILQHEKKRRIEVKCLEMRDMMLNNG